VRRCLFVAAVLVAGRQREADSFGVSPSDGRGVPSQLANRPECDCIGRGGPDDGIPWSIVGGKKSSSSRLFVRCEPRSVRRARAARPDGPRLVRRALGGLSKACRPIVVGTAESRQGVECVDRARVAAKTRHRFPLEVGRDKHIKHRNFGRFTKPVELRLIQVRSKVISATLGSTIYGNQPPATPNRSHRNLPSTLASSTSRESLAAIEPADPHSTHIAVDSTAPLG
jgi:hypothetical protein